VTGIIRLVFNVYAIGLLVLIILNFAHWPPGKLYAGKLEPFYNPFLTPLKDLQRKTFLRDVKFDLSPFLLLAGVFLVRQLVVHLLI
jgi:uncharacterized protein YggT (Ycf19 family)